MIDQWLQDVKREYRDKELGMILVHNGIVRATSKDRKKVRGMNLSWDTEKLDALIREFKKKAGIAAIRVWINKGELMVGDDIMYVLVAGRFRTDVLPVLGDLVYRLKNEVIKETEI
jgi:molybdopterin synthase catalytic subunit